MHAIRRANVGEIPPHSSMVLGSSRFAPPHPGNTDVLLAVTVEQLGPISPSFTAMADELYDNIPVKPPASARLEGSDEGTINSLVLTGGGSCCRVLDLRRSSSPASNELRLIMLIVLVAAVTWVFSNGRFPDPFPACLLCRLSKVIGAFVRQRNFARDCARATLANLAPSALCR
jgi:hypothetical protein